MRSLIDLASDREQHQRGQSDRNAGRYHRYPPPPWTGQFNGWPHIMYEPQTIAVPHAIFPAHRVVPEHTLSAHYIRFSFGGRPRKTTGAPLTAAVTGTAVAAGGADGVAFAVRGKSPVPERTMAVANAPRQLLSQTRREQACSVGRCYRTRLH